MRYVSDNIYFKSGLNLDDLATKYSLLSANEAPLIKTTSEKINDFIKKGNRAHQFLTTMYRDWFATTLLSKMLTDEYGAK